MSNETLIHWGIKGQKWGIRRFQNKNGSLTPEGKKRYADKSDETFRKITDDAEKIKGKYKAAPGKTKDVIGKYKETRNTPIGKRVYLTTHIVDEYGDVKLSYFRSKDGDRYFAAGKDYVDKHINLDDYFYNTKNLKIEYDIYK